MAVAAFLLIVISLSYVSSLNENTTDYCNQLNCPPWMQAMGSECVCRTDLPYFFSCDNNIAYIDISNCMSIDNDTVSVGECPYNYPNVSGYAVELPSSLSDHELDTVFCDPLNREGILCHHCKEGFGVAPLSLEYVCAECSDNTGWWVLFLLLQFGPITIFYLINLVWQVSFAKAPFRGFVFFSQIFFWIMSTQSVIIARNNLNVVGKVCFYTVQFLNGIWSLNFVSVLPPFCVSTSFKNIDLVYLQYFVAVYPLFLIALTLVLYMLHERNFKPVVILWKPFRRCFISTKQTCDCKSSIVNVIANFCLFSLSNIISIISTSFDVSEVFNLCVADGEVERSLWVDPSFPYPDPGLLFLSLVFSIITITVIALVSSYPLKCMKLCLKRCCRSQIFLYSKAFFDDFTSSYKDGSSKGSCFNWQYLTILYPVLLILSRVMFLAVRRTDRFLLPSMYSLLLFSLAMFVSLGRPYKKAIDNVIESLLIFLLALVFGFFSLYVYFEHIFLAYASLFLATVPQGCFVMFVAYSVYTRYKKYCVCCCKKKKEMVEDIELPDRFVNAENYPQHNAPKTARIIGAI